MPSTVNPPPCPGLSGSGERELVRRRARPAADGRPRASVPLRPGRSAPPSLAPTAKCRPDRRSRSPGRRPAWPGEAPPRPARAGCCGRKECSAASASSTTGSRPLSNQRPECAGLAHREIRQIGLLPPSAASSALTAGRLASRASERPSSEKRSISRSAAAGSCGAGQVGGRLNGAGMLKENLSRRAGEVKARERRG